MNNVLYVVVVLLVIFWAIGYFALSAGGLIHLLLMIAVIVVLIRIIRGRKPLF